MTPKGTLETLGQIGFIVMTIAVTAAAAHHLAVGRASPPRTAPPPAVAEGTQLKLPAHATDGGRASSLLLVLSSECRFCTESMPFYRRLAEERAITSGRVKFSVVSVQPVEVMRTYLASHNFSPSAVLTAEETGAYVRGTPSLILTDAQGVVTASWSGALPPAEERSVVAALTRLQEGVSK